MSRHFHFKWREPWLLRLRLHGDAASRGVLSLALAILAGSVFYLIGLVEKGWQAAPLAGLFGALFFGGIFSLGVFFSPEGLRSRVTIGDQKIRRHRDTFGFGQGEHIREQWNCNGLACVVVPAALLRQSFSLLMLPGPAARHAVYIGVPNRIDLAELTRFLTAAGVYVEAGTAELVNSVKADRPYRSLLARSVLVMCIVISLGILVTVVMAGNQIAGKGR